MKRNNPFIALCKFEGNVDIMTFENCNLFKRSTTTQGLGYTFNGEIQEKLYKENFRSKALSQNVDKSAFLMKFATSEPSLTVVIENNEEYTTKIMSDNNDDGAKKISVSLHNPKEPSDTKFKPSSSIKIPLGHSTTFLITPKAREIDDSGKALTETERGCRLDEDTEALDIFNVYTRAGCLFECKIRYAEKKCGCTPWYYPVNMQDKVKN